MRKLFLSLLLLFGCLFLVNAQSVKFGVISDLHHDNLDGVKERMELFIVEAEREGVDFIIDLGDFCHSIPQNQHFIDRWKGASCESYNVLGNHDIDHNSKDEAVKFFGMENRYYSFDKGDFHFIVLDLNNVCGNEREALDAQQIEWLEKDINSSDKKCVVFSHQSLANDGVSKESVRAIFERANSKNSDKKIAAVFFGHDHCDYIKEINGISYIAINSASYKWVGDEYPDTTRYPKEYYERYPILKVVAPYIDPLYAIVDVNTKRVKINGNKSDFVAPTLKELNVPLEKLNNPTTTYIKDRVIKF